MGEYSEGPPQGQLGGWPTPDVPPNRFLYNRPVTLQGERVVSPARQVSDPTIQALRPARLSDMIGQDRVRENLGILIQAARSRGEPLDHVLFYGPPGLGKTTLAHILANEMDSNFKITSESDEWITIECPMPPNSSIWMHRSQPSRQSLTT